MFFKPDSANGPVQAKVVTLQLHGALMQQFQTIYSLNEWAQLRDTKTISYHTKITSSAQILLLLLHKIGYAYNSS